MAESKRYIACHEFECAFIYDKQKSAEIVVEEFYGDPEFAIISPDERFIVFAGEGVVVYYMDTCKQISWARDYNNPESIKFVENICLVDHNTLQIVLEDGSDHLLPV